MASRSVMECFCQWNLEQPKIWLCPDCHRYRKGKTEYTSVSKVIKALMPADYAGIDPIVLEIARLRGVFVDRFISDWLIDQNDVLPLEAVRELTTPLFPRDGELHAADTIHRIEMFCDWWIGKGWKATGVQKIVYNDMHRVAGTLDLRTDGLVADIKCVSSLQPNYALQLGAYSMYDAASSVAIIHVTKDKVRLVEYDNQKCQAQWLNGLVWWQTAKELAG